ncbi:MAG TPA: peptidylprolyl isomerase, partial [Burkholderiaceae bacterium]|nr:peptidylprolyl isomerase [Burkholderiaceae bacterium]
PRVAVPAATPPPRTADYILAVVNTELVTNNELQQRLARIREDASRSNATLPPPAELRKQVLDVLIDERVQITNARDSGQRIDDNELDRAVANVAVQNQLTMPQLLDRLKTQGIPYATFRNNVRDQLLIERVREREVSQRIKISAEEVDAFLDKRRAAAGTSMQLNIAQVLVTVPEGASEADVAQRRARAEAAFARIKSGESFEAVAREVSEDGNRAQGGVIGLRPADRLPDVFVEVVRPLKPGDVSPTLLRSGAGFHIIKLVERKEAGGLVVTQTHARHILLRVSPQLSQEAAVRRMADFKRQIVSGTRTFEQIARENSEDGSAQQGGDLGWASPGNFVPEFEEAMNALPLNGLSEPIVSRFGVHLLQVLERRQTTVDLKQAREQARNVLREQKFEDAYLEWIRDLRGRAYIEMREPPQS